MSINAAQLKSIRARERKTQKEFAELLGVNLRTYQNWECGRNRPAQMVETVLKAMGITIPPV